MPNQLSTIKSFTPLSSNVGTSGTTLDRFAAATLSARNFPPFTIGADTADATKTLVICPATVSDTDRPPPLYGT